MIKTESFASYENVTPATDLRSLNLEWSENELPEMERTKHVHRLHPYLGKFVPQLVEIFLRKYSPNLVYDPFCGSGTTLVEAKSLGIDSVGIDISEFNVLLSKVKTASYDIETLFKEVNEVISYIDNSSNNTLFSCKPIKIDTNTNNDYLNSWFAEKALAQLLQYRAFIDQMCYKNFFEIVLSRAARSARLTTHFDLDFPKRPQTTPYECYKHNQICYPVDAANQFLRRYTWDSFTRIKTFAELASSNKQIIEQGDACVANLPTGIDMVFTSPPYLGLIDYHEQHRYAYELLGLPNNESYEIGSAKKGTSKNAKKDYVERINHVFTHAREHMVTKSIMCIVVNDRYDLYRPEQSGFKSIENIRRLVDRRTSRRSKPFYENILIWQKI